MNIFDFFFRHYITKLDFILGNIESLGKTKLTTVFPLRANIKCILFTQILRFYLHKNKSSTLIEPVSVCDIVAVSLQDIRFSIP